MRTRRRFVQRVREARDKRHAPERRVESEGARQREHWVDFVGHEDLNLARPHRGNQIGHIAVRARAPIARIWTELRGGADVSGHVIQQVHRNLRSGCVRTRRCHASADCETAARPSLRVAEQSGEIGDRLRRNARAAGNRIRRERRNQVADGCHLGGRDRLRSPLGQNDVHHGERDEDFGARPRGEPFIGVRCRERESRLDVDEARLAAVPQPACLGESAAVLDRREPGLQKVGPKGNEHVGARQFVVRDPVPTEANSAGGPKCFVCKRLIPKPPGAESLRPRVEETVQRSSKQGCDDNNPVCPAVPARHSKTVGQCGERIFPRDRRQTALASGCVHDFPAPRSANPVRVVETLKRRLSPDAETALVYGVVPIPFDFDGTSVERAYRHPAAGGTLPAACRVPRRDAWNLVLRRDDVRNDPLGWDGRAGARRDRRRRGTKQLEERPPTDAFDQGSVVAGV